MNGKVVSWLKPGMKVKIRHRDCVSGLAYMSSYFI